LKRIAGVKALIIVAVDPEPAPGSTSRFPKLRYSDARALPT
jgi:hypothetical protein